MRKQHAGTIFALLVLLVIIGLDCVKIHYLRAGHPHIASVWEAVTWVVMVIGGVVLFTVYR